MYREKTCFWVQSTSLYTRDNWVQINTQAHQVDGYTLTSRKSLSRQNVFNMGHANTRSINVMVKQRIL